MKKIYLLLTMSLIIFASCKEDDEQKYQTYPFNVELVYPTGERVESMVDVKINAKASSGVVYSVNTNASGIAEFNLPAGLYEISATDKRTSTGKSKIFTAINPGVVVGQAMLSPIKLNLQASELSQIIIKELYNGGCQKDDGSGAYNSDKYMILYNNSDEPAELKNLCVAIALPYNSTVVSSDYTNGSLFYESEGWIPAGLGYFYFANPTSLGAGEQLVVAFNNANDNTLVYSNSVDLSNSNYYVTYAPEVYTNTIFHPAPSANISTNHYLPGFKYGTANAWALSNTSPALFLFVPEDGQTPGSFNEDATNISLYGGSATQVRKKVPTSWVIDAIEVFRYGATNNVKRLTGTVDVGYTYLTSGHGYTLYRNVDRTATEAIESNANKLVYSYALGTETMNGTTDPSGIDAEASIKNGARIVYLDTNNSTNDFHQRARSSLRN